MMQQLQNWDEKTVLRILLVVAVASLGLSAISHWLDGEAHWWGWADGAFQNFSTEMIGAVVTFALFELVIGAKKQEQYDDKQKIYHANEWLSKQQNAISRLKQAANLKQKQAIIDEMTTLDLLHDADLKEIDLKNIYLYKANLTRTKFWGANLKGAYFDRVRLTMTNLASADLEKAIIHNSIFENVSFSGANLSLVEFSKNTFSIDVILPDATTEGAMSRRNHLGIMETTSLIGDKHWTPETDMSRYTDPTHPNFWQPDWAKEQSPND